MSDWPRLSAFLWAHRDAPTLSVYLEAAPSDPAAGRAAGLRLRDAIQRTRESLRTKPEPERAALEASIDELIEHIPNAEHRSRRAGWAFFRSADGASLMIATPPRVETVVAWGSGPLVIPFLRAAETESALIVQVDREESRISLLHDDTVDGIVTLTAEPAADGDAPPARHDAPRQRYDASERLLITTLRRVVTLAEDVLPVVVGGADTMARRVINWMPSALAARSIALPSLRMQDAATMLPAILDALRALRAREQATHLEELRDAARANGRAAIGLERIRAAAEVGAIAELIFSDAAWRAHPDEIEGLVHRALTGGARVEWTALEPPEPGATDGIVARLRFPV